MSYSEWLEHGLALIPVRAKTKRTFIQEWTKYSNRLPTEDEAQEWDARYSSENVALVCGEASGIVAVDIDTDNQDTHKIVPQSPYARRGRPGRETRFFKYNKFIRSQKYLELGVEIHSDNNYTLVPPSIHPDTNEPYQWISSHKLPDKEMLPDLDLSFIELLPLIKSKDSVVRSGRNNTLVQIVTSMRCRGDNEEKIINEIYEYDRDKNRPRLFTDKNEGYFAANEDDAKNNAWIFVLNVSRSLVKSKKAILPIQDIILVDENKSEVAVENVFKYRALPEPKGFLQGFVSICNQASMGRTDCLALGGALSVLSVLASNRFEFDGVRSNLYVLNIASSGAGKSLPQDLAKELLIDTNLLGAGNYRSSAGVYLGLPKQQNRLDIIDEASSLLKAMGSSESWQSDINELLCALFSCASSYFAGYSSRLNGEHDGFCYNPCLSVLASTTPAGFFSAIKRDVAVKGLLPRFLMFYQYDVGEYKPRRPISDFKEFIESLREFVDWIEKIERVEIPMDQPDELVTQSELSGEVVFKGKKFKPYSMSTSREAKDCLDALDKKYFYKMKQMKLDDDDHLGAFYARFGELSRKVAMIHALSNKRTSIELEDVLFATSLVESQFYNSIDFVTSSTAATQRESLQHKILRLVQKSGEMSVRDLIRKTKLTRRELDVILEVLIESGEVIRILVRSRSGQSVDKIRAATVERKA